MIRIPASTKRLVLLCLAILAMVVPLRAHAQPQGSGKYFSTQFEFEHRRYMFSREAPGSARK